MNIYKKTLSIVLLMLFSLTSCATPIGPTPLKQEKTTRLSLSDVCSLIGNDGYRLAQMYQAGLSKKEIAEILSKRNERFPTYVAIMPGILRILYVLESAKKNNYDVMMEPEFADAVGNVAYKKCVAEVAQGWVQDVPGRATVIRPDKKKRRGPSVLNPPNEVTM